jgi:MerR family transcriptional regulator, copper efflux regulator
VHSGELARLAGVSTDTLRHYERLGLLPKPPRTGGGYRNYPANALERVRVLRRALCVGFSLPELTTILRMRDRGEVPCHRVQAIAKSKLQQIEKQIHYLIEMRDHLTAILKDWDTKLAHTRKGESARLLEHLARELPGVHLNSKLTKRNRTGSQM